ncbi:hypothetical protein ACVGVM_03095 [Pseudonocardia bannensis]|uniref:Septum formation initiator n=1 Tax=Pseudonocardia bannensis TaxID=630973 RepID=A0A848DQG9_9PSEU|nr:hypothetical protein [Pseudonocardia bannensis]NMH95100.1 hypothetical protein [Pseudonocardia bannensis]
MSRPEPDRPARRPGRGRGATLLVLWTLAVVGATLVGMTAVGAIGSGIVGSAQRPLSQAEIDARLAAAPTAGTVLPGSARPPEPVTPATSAATTSGTTASGTTASGTTGVVPAGPAGTVLARCVNGVPSVVAVNPAQGYGARDEHEGGDRPRVRFESDTGRVEVRLGCQDGRPTGELRVDGD